MQNYLILLNIPVFFIKRTPTLGAGVQYQKIADFYLAVNVQV